ncbi:hypothetical protein EON09_02000 [Pseudomonas soli]|jgi:hypothetical protein|uniref:DUF4142 domain-containing protein n=1 Tax=Pseudomonas soli TaxID=1306993 RepID=A0A1H9JBI5_9PSED|nr:MULTISPECIES: hypothetical protein [Pseudomonas]AIN58069.1 hypothetical protein O165_007085 [Pseudomonas soli]AUY32496.1 hypothetical protein C3F42_04345 [Pseudomonas sp. PONIH3]MCX5506657.1 hypothetical protein [Pseudomonas sp. BJa3]MDT3712641.1 hypothetical protein [Pseudomonas soli]MDT3729978.1 hypothetical protein [Pseudomonas soli]
MSRLTRLLLPVLLLGALAACDQKPSREEQILANLPLQEAYDHNIERMAGLLAMTHTKVPQEQIKEVLRKHLTVEDQRQDLFKLYSEEHFNDAEFANIVQATRDPAKAKELGQSDQGKRLSEKLTRLMRESASDPQVQALAQARMQEVEDDLSALEQALP